MKPEKKKQPPEKPVFIIGNLTPEQEAEASTQIIELSQMSSEKDPISLGTCYRCQSVKSITMFDRVKQPPYPKSDRESYLLCEDCFFSEIVWSVWLDPKRGAHGAYRVTAWLLGVADLIWIPAIGDWPPTYAFFEVFAKLQKAIVARKVEKFNA